MPELRKDPFSDRWVIFAEDRDRRPNEYRRTHYQRQASRCPFCAGNERSTPAPIALYGHNHQPKHPASQLDQDWLVRVVPNKFPALTKNGSADTSPLAPQLPRAEPRPVLNPLFESRPAIGSHEVVVESPRHVASLTALTDDEVKLAIRAYHDRLRHLRQLESIAYALVFKNVGPAAGASLEHAHSQIAATPIVPIDVQRELDAAAHYYATDGCCAYCRILDQEFATGDRVVAETTHFFAFCPYASRTPYEMWILPKRHVSHFDQQNSDSLPELALFLRQCLRQLESLHPHLAYNFFIHTAPFDTSDLDHYHWHIEVIPRLTTAAGFEWGAGCFINPVLPEKAAMALRG
jgi:UDPglucose--hexose-1-phosphate uridylyltransferase